MSVLVVGGGQRNKIFKWGIKRQRKHNFPLTFCHFLVHFTCR
jgi:hypothetical protein